MGNGSFTHGPASGEIASVANGLSGNIVNKVVLASVATTSNAWVSSTNGGTGVLGVQIRNSAGTSKYIFTGGSSTFTTTGLTQTTYCSSQPSAVNAINNITLQDDTNTYVMQTGDVLLITWSGTGNNEAALAGNTSSPAGGKATFWNGSAYSGPVVQDIAMTVYQATTVYNYSLPTDDVPFGTDKLKKLSRQTGAGGINDTLTVTETRKKKAFKKKTDTAMTLADAEARLKRARKTIATDTLTFGTDTIKKFGLKKRTESLTIADPMIGMGKHFRAIVESAISIGSDALALLVHPKIATDTISVSESISRFKKGIKMFTETMAIAMGFVKKRNSVIDAQDGLDEMVPLSEAFRKKASLKRADTMSITDPLRKLSRKPKTDTMTLLEASVKKKSVKPSISEFLGISDVLVKLARHRFADTLVIGADTFQKIHRFIRPFTEGVRTIVRG